MLTSAKISQVQKTLFLARIFTNKIFKRDSHRPGVNKISLINFTPYLTFAKLCTKRTQLFFSLICRSLFIQCALLLTDATKLNHQFYEIELSFVNSTFFFLFFAVFFFWPFKHKTK